ncbi:molybdate transport system regulatory protein ModE [Methanobrevibacter ruminantium M1]|uniref:Molybdate transport system regulatory protein ModE n=1 Tax=Methanobrevibacter ruminantium (strain ATCC 35063 / DSM 1093 / JCM 13430 / OCM 146 / M1) TaxID=634498 RepID=D3E113_METRM|nr:TOBE domain-containing protein [Methanobrevibacter ruminantium]ADC47987.1 molybdate transport system regulatory protein ModE [Methanobrevibacter ruminantium M1]
MTDVKAGVEYKINIDGNSFLLDEKKFNLLLYINESGSITEAAKRTKISYRTALHYIEKIETTLNIAIVSTKKGGTGGGGGTKLTEEGLQIVKECKKINAIMELHRDVNELEAEILEVDASKGIMKIKMEDLTMTMPLNKKYVVGDKILALISYDNIFIMLEPQASSIRNIFKGIVTEMRLQDEMVRVKIDIGGVDIFSDITLSAGKDLDLNLGKEVYIGFKALSIATLKL